MDKCEAIERLAMLLHDKMEHLDPTVEGAGWLTLTEHQRDFYRLCVETILAEPELVRDGMG